MNSQWSYKYACSHLLHLLADQTWPNGTAERLQERAQLVFRSLSPYAPTYLGQHLTDSRSLYFDAYLRTPLLAEIEVYSTRNAANPAPVYVRLLVEGQYVLQQEMRADEVGAHLAQYYAAAPPR